MSETLFSVVYIIAIFVLIEFVRAKDGMLRKLMICYFIVEFYTYFGASIYYLAVHERWTTMGSDIYRIIIITPKVFVKLALLTWLIKNRPKNRK